MINIIPSIPIIGIYIIISPSNKIYIGQSIDINRRKTYYCGLQCKRQPKIYNSLSKYGFENHKFNIIEECNEDQLNEREIYWKQHYINILGWKNMLFCKTHDEGGGCLSNEIKYKISQSNKGKLRPKTKEWASKLGGKGTPRIKLQKPILQKDLEGNIITEWNSASQAELIIAGNKDKDNIRACVRGRQKTAYGYIWEEK